MGNVVKKVACCKPVIESKVLILGLDNAGKTTLLYKLTTNDGVHTVPTIGYNFEEYLYKNFRFLMWDIGGQTAMRPAWSSYFPEAKAVIIVVDSVDVERLIEVKAELEKLMDNDHLKESAFLIFANKQDQEQALNPTELSRRIGIPSISSHTVKLQPCSAVSGSGLQEGLDWLITVTQKK